MAPACRRCGLDVRPTHPMETGMSLEEEWQKQKDDSDSKRRAKIAAERAQEDKREAEIREKVDILKHLIGGREESFEFALDDHKELDWYNQSLMESIFKKANTFKDTYYMDVSKDGSKSGILFCGRFDMLQESGNFEYKFYVKENGKVYVKVGKLGNNFCPTYGMHGDCN